MSSGERRVIGLTALFGVSGILHFVIPKPYEKIVPPQLGDPAALVKVSGVAELVTAGLIATPATRRLGAWLGVGLLASVFPANVYSVKVVGPNRLAQAGAVARLPMQVPMIVTALKVARSA